MRPPKPRFVSNGNARCVRFALRNSFGKTSLSFRAQAAGVEESAWRLETSRTARQCCQWCSFVNDGDGFSEKGENGEASMEVIVQSEIRLQPKNGWHQFSVYVRD